jgi:chymotrypsin-like protease
MHALDLPRLILIFSNNKFSAYCVYGASSIQVTVGDTDISATGTAKTRYTVMAKQWIKHENFSTSTLANDIALVYLPVNVYRSTNVDIAYLYLNDPADSSVFNTYFLNQLVNVAGWGRISQTGAYSDTLKHTEVKIIDAATCQPSYTITIDSKRLCIKSGSTTTMQVSYSFY